MVGGLEGEPFKRKINDSPGVYGRKVMANSVLCMKCGNWVYGRCAKIKRFAATLATGLVA